MPYPPRRTDPVRQETWSPGEANSRSPGLLVGVGPFRIAAIAVSAENQRSRMSARARVRRIWIEIRGVVVRFLPRDVKVLAQAEVEREVGPELQVVLHICGKVLLDPPRDVSGNLAAGAG